MKRVYYIMKYFRKVARTTMDTELQIKTTRPL
jgi:hypothetical protein